MNTPNGCEGELTVVRTELTKIKILVQPSDIAYSVPTVPDVHIVSKKINAFFFFFYFAHQTYGTVLQHDNARPHTGRNTTRFLTNNKVQNSPLNFLVPRLKPQQNTLGTSWRDVFETEWTPLQMCVSCFRRSSRSGWPSHCKKFTTWGRTYELRISPLIAFISYPPFKLKKIACLKRV